MIDSLVVLWERIDHQTLANLKFVVAVCATLLLFWEIGTKTQHDWQRRLRSWLLGALGIIGLGCWWELGHFHYPGYLQIHEHYHYYLGAKYFPELEYTRLYQCTALADTEAGFHPATDREWIRDLSTNQLRPAKAFVNEPATCTSHFTPARWEMFKRDVAWFRSHRTPEQWNIALVDHGYNGTPLWAAEARLLIPERPVTDAEILALGLIDPLLILTMWGFVWWAFGWRTMCVGMIWFGTNNLATFFWTGGALLRADWLALSVIGVCLVKGGRPTLAGAALTYAALLRIFPVFIIAGLALKAIVDMCLRRAFSLDPAHRAFAVGSVAAALVLITFSIAGVGRGMTGGVHAWQGFVANSRKHLATAAVNNMGLKPVLSFAPSSRAAAIGEFWMDTPGDTWAEARHRVFAQRQPLFWLLLVAFLALLVHAIEEQEDWAALALATSLVPVAAELSCYYYSIFVLFALLGSKWEWNGAALCALSALSLLIPAIFPLSDDMYTALSVVTLLYVATAMCVIRFASNNSKTLLSGMRTDHANAGY